MYKEKIFRLLGLTSILVTIPSFIACSNNPAPEPQGNIPGDEKPEKKGNGLAPEQSFRNLELEAVYQRNWSDRGSLLVANVYDSLYGEEHHELLDNFYEENDKNNNLDLRDLVGRRNTGRRSFLGYPIYSSHRYYWPVMVELALYYKVMKTQNMLSFDFTGLMAGWKRQDPLYLRFGNAIKMTEKRYNEIKAHTEFKNEPDVNWNNLQYEQYKF